LNTKVLQGSVSTRLRSMWYITQSLLSPRMKKFGKSINICRSYGLLSTGSFFMKHRVCYMY